MEKYEIAAVVLEDYGYEDLAKSVEANMRISEIAAGVLENFGHVDIVRDDENKFFDICQKCFSTLTATDTQPRLLETSSSSHRMCAECCEYCVPVELMDFTVVQVFDEVVCNDHYITYKVQAYSEELRKSQEASSKMTFDICESCQNSETEPEILTWSSEKHLSTCDHCHSLQEDSRVEQIEFDVRLAFVAVEKCYCYYCIQYNERSEKQVFTYDVIT